MLDQVTADIKEAMKNKEKERLNALRYLKAMLIENKTAKAPKEELDVVVALNKKLKDSLENFPKDSEQYASTQKEIEFIGAYLPKPLSEQEVESLIKKAIADLENPSMGAVMKEISAQVKGRFDGKRTSEMVKSILGQ